MAPVEQAAPRSIHAELQAAIAKAHLQHDPMALVLELQWLMVDRIERAIATPRAQMTPDETRQLANALKRALRMPTTTAPTTRTRAAIVGLAGACLLLMGVGMVWYCSGYSATNNQTKEPVVCRPW